MNTPDPIDLVVTLNFYSVNIDGHIQWVVTRWEWEEVRIPEVYGTKIDFVGPACDLKQWCENYGYGYCHRVEYVPLYLEWEECHISSQNVEKT
jgi:hypothetical protein